MGGRAAASVGVHLVRHGYHVRLLTDTGANVASAAHDASGVGSDYEGSLLDALAVLQLSANTSLRDASAALRRGGGEGLLVAVLGGLDLEETRLLARLRHGSTAAIAIVLDTGTWNLTPGRARVSTAEVDGASELLRASGWRVLRVRAGDSLPDLWQDAGRARVGVGPHHGRLGAVMKVMSGSLRMPVAAAFATIAASLCLAPVFLIGSWFLPTAFAVLVVGAGCEVARRLSASRSTVPLGGLAALPVPLGRYGNDEACSASSRPGRSTTSPSWPRRAATTSTGSPRRSGVPRYRAARRRRRRTDRAGRRHPGGDLATGRAGRPAPARALHRADRRRARRE